MKIFSKTPFIKGSPSFNDFSTLSHLQVNYIIMGGQCIIMRVDTNKCGLHELCLTEII